MMKLKVIGSSSAGNCYLLETGSTCLIIEAGIPFVQVKHALGYDIRKIQGVIISHAHQDHSKYAREYLKAGIHIYTGAHTLDALGVNYYNAHEIKAHKEFSLGLFKIIAFDVRHDVPCFGFLIYHPKSGRVVFLTDGQYSPYRFIGVSHWLIEANYDQKILDDNICKGKLPPVVRNRVMRSHVSLDTCKKLLMANDLNVTMNIILLHLSSGNSDECRFRDEIQALTGKRVTIADRGVEIELSRDPF